MFVVIVFVKWFKINKILIIEWRIVILFNILDYGLIVCFVEKKLIFEDR